MRSAEALLAIERGLRRAVREIVPFWAKRFTNSQDYWRRRYAFGGSSGSGSRGADATYKARVVNDLCREMKIDSVIDVGCGDGRIAAMLTVPNYTGVDISPHALALAKARCAGRAGRRFGHIDEANPADLALSMDVIFHLVEDEIYHSYLSTLAGLGRRFCLVYATNMDRTEAAHVRHRAYSADFVRLPGGWRLRECMGLVSPETPHFCLFERTP